MIIAIDGPAASGKGTIGRRLANYLGFHHLDTGLLYRAVAAELLAARRPIDNEDEAAVLARRLPFDEFDEHRLGAPEIGEAASRVASMPGVRAALIDRQRDFAQRLPGAVIVGRDIGTVVCPDADVKIFLTASAEIRASRRSDQLAIHDGAGRQRVLEGIRDRDNRDINRPVAPLRQAAKARLLDTTELDIEAAFHAALEIVDQVTGKTI